MIDETFVTSTTLQNCRNKSGWKYLSNYWPLKLKTAFDWKTWLLLALEIPFKVSSFSVQITCIALAGCKDSNWPLSQGISPKEHLTECYSFCLQHPCVQNPSASEQPRRACRGPRRAEAALAGQSLTHFQQHYCTTTETSDGNHCNKSPHAAMTRKARSSSSENSMSERSLTSQADPGKNNSRVFLLLERLILSLFPYHPILTVLTSVTLWFFTCS